MKNTIIAALLAVASIAAHAETIAHTARKGCGTIDFTAVPCKDLKSNAPAWIALRRSTDTESRP